MRKLALALVVLAIVVAAPACRSKGLGRSLGRTLTFPAKADRSGDATLALEGASWGSGTTAVVFAHSYPTTQDAWLEFARTMAAQGFLTLTFNFRGYGRSEGVKDPSRADLDLEAAVAEVTSLGATRVVVVGASMGGTAALIVGSRQTLAGVVTLSAPLAFMGLDASRAVRALREPVLFIAALGDPARAAAAARALEASAPQPKQIDVVAGAEHGTDMLGGGQGQRVRTDIAQFLIDRRDSATMGTHS